MKVDYEILSLFKGNPEKEYSTSDIISNLYSQENKEIEEKLESLDISFDHKRELRDRLAKLHRRVLYHLSTLVKKELLIVTRIEEKGRKYYALAIQEGEELVIDRFKRKIIITKPSTPNLPLGDLEERKLAYRVEPDTFFERVNAILVEGDKFEDLKSLYDYIYDLFSEVNDVIGVNDFEKVMQENSAAKIAETLKKLGEECEAYNKTVCCIIDFTNITKETVLEEFFTKYLEDISLRVNFVFDVTAREVLAKSEIMEMLITVYSSSKRKLCIKNEDLHKTPYFTGRSGPYCFEPKLWKQYLEKHQKDSIGLICTQSAIVTDVKEFFRDKPSASKFKDHILKLAKALFFANIYQRKNSLRSFKKLSETMESWQTFEYSKNYIRLWNFEMNEDREDNLYFLETLEDIKKEIENFSKNQETIYLSCGMPTSFKIGFSTAYKNFDKDKPLVENFEPISLANTKDLYTNSIKERIFFLEKVFKLLDGGFEVKFVRSGNIKTTDILREFNIILNSHYLPFFCYDFKSPAGVNMNLNKFI